MSMSKDRSNDEDGEIVAEINMTPLIDIMLVLMIIFMVTSSLTLNPEIDVNLPKSKNGQGGEEKNGDAVVVALNKGGDIFVQGEKVLRNEVRIKIDQALKKQKTEEVVFQGDDQSTLGQAVELINEAKEAGAKNFAIATEQQ